MSSGMGREGRGGGSQYAKDLAKRAGDCLCLQSLKTKQ